MIEMSLMECAAHCLLAIGVAGHYNNFIQCRIMVVFMGNN